MTKIAYGAQALKTRLYWFRVFNEISLIELATESGIDQSTLLRLERRLIQPSEAIEAKLNACFGRNACDGLLERVTREDFASDWAESL